MLYVLIRIAALVVSLGTYSNAGADDAQFQSFSRAFDRVTERGQGSTDFLLVERGYFHGVIRVAESQDAAGVVDLFDEAAKEFAERAGAGFVVELVRYQTGSELVVEKSDETYGDSIVRKGVITDPAFRSGSRFVSILIQKPLIGAPAKNIF